MTPASTILLDDYADEVRGTDRLSESDLKPVLMGLFGETGSIMAPAKKLHREKGAYSGYRDEVVEEFGDTLWYFAALLRRVGLRLSDVFGNALRDGGTLTAVAAGDRVDGPIVRLLSAPPTGEMDEVLLALGAAAADLLPLAGDRSIAAEVAERFALAYVGALRAAGIPFATVCRLNLDKVRGRFLEPKLLELPTFDSAFPEDERLPDRFEVEFVQRSGGRCAMKWNGVFIGDPLTDSIFDRDGYRFHDVFHLAHAAVLHWSPTFRALIRHKRKSDPEIDEAQDGGRAVVVEEGLTAWLFSRAKLHGLFRGRDGVSLGTLKTVQQFVAGYEVDACPLSLWESAILQGYTVFRQVQENGGGIVIGNRRDRTVGYVIRRGAANGS